MDKKRHVQPYKPLRALEVATLLLMEYVPSGACLLGWDPMTFTQCRENIDGYLGAVVGFKAEGLFVDPGIIDFVGGRCCGLTGVRMF